MHPVKLAAQYAAYVWFLEVLLRCPGDDVAPRQRVTEALRFARRHWRLFMPCATTGLGKLLMKIGRARRHVGTGMGAHDAQ